MSTRPGQRPSPILRKVRRARELAEFLYLQRVKGFDPPEDEPWMDSQGIARFKAELAICSAYLEYGSGGTTVLADKAGIPAISVESDPYYARAVASRLVGKVQQLVVDLGLTGPFGAPVFGTADKGRRYAGAPFVSGFQPDFVLVDGRYRVACALRAACEVFKLGGTAVLMFDDYVDRPNYHAVEQLLGAPEYAGRAAMFRIGKQAVTEDDVERFVNDQR